MAIPVFLILFLLVPAALFVRAGRRRAADPALVTSWAAAHRVAVPPTAEPAVRAALARLVGLQAWGAALGWLAGVTRLPGAPLSNVAAGFLVGTVAGAVQAARLFGRGTASLAPRRFQDYAPAQTVRLLRIAATGGPAALLVGSALPARAGVSGRGALIALAGVTLGLGLVSELLGRWVIRRPQRAGDAALLAVDDAIRATAVGHVLASGLALVLLAFGAGAIVLASVSDVQVLRWAGLPLAVASLVGAVAAWQVLGPQPWPVRRPHRAQAA